MLAARSGRVSQIKPLADQLQIAVQSVDEMGRQIEEWYIHTSDALVQVGDQVQAGQKIAEVAHTTQRARNARVSTGDHLDYRVRVDGDWVDPKTMLSGLPAGGAVPQMPISAGGSRLTVKGQATTQEQIGIARRIYQVGSNLGANNAEIQAAISTAIQESALTNLSGGDRDSLGIFQQRPSMEWGSRSQIQNLDFAIESFFEGRGSNPGMLDNRGRAGGDVYQQSHLTQRSAHPDAPRQWDSEAAALLRAVSGRESVPTPGLNIAQFRAAQTIGGQNFSVEAELINQQEQSAIALQQATARLQSLGLVNQAVQQQRTVADQDLELSRQTADRSIQLLPQGETRETAEGLIGQVRDIQDQTIQINRQLEDSQMQLASADEMLQVLADSRAYVAQQVEAGALSKEELRAAEEAIAQFERAANAMQESDAKLAAFRDGLLNFETERLNVQLTRDIDAAKEAARDVDPIIAATGELRRELEALEGSATQTVSDFQASLESAGFNEKVIADLVGKYQELNDIRLTNLRTEIDDLTRSIQIAADAAIIQFKGEGLGELTRILNRSGQPLQAQEANYQNQLDQISNEEQQKLLEIAQDPNLSAEQKEQARGYVRDTAANRRINAEYDFTMQQRETELGGRRAVLDNRQSLLGAYQSQADMLGFGGIAPLRQEEMNLQLEIQQLDYESQLMELERMRESVGLTNEQFSEMQAVIEQTNQLSIDNIKTQFSDLPELVGAIKQPMTDALSSWIQGTKSFDEAFSDMLGSILSNLISMMANKAIEGLLGGLLGGGGGFGGGQVGGIPGMGGGFGGGGLMGIVGGLFGGLFKDGGKIGFMAGGHLRGGDPIKDAMRKEGPGARLIVANTSEWVLNRKHQEILKAYGVDEKVLGFKDGGPVGGKSFSPAVRGGGNTGGNLSVSIPITVNGAGSEDDGRELAKHLADPIKALVSSEVARMRKPGGALRSRK